MCDPIGAISLAASVLSTCYIYVCEFAVAPNEARRLGTEVSAVAGLLVSVKAISASSEDQIAVDNLQAVLDGCQQALQDVSDRLERHNPNIATSHLQRLKKRARWPLSKEATAELVAIMERQKVTLNTALIASAVYEPK